MRRTTVYTYCCWCYLRVIIRIGRTAKEGSVRHLRRVVSKLPSRGQEIKRGRGYHIITFLWCSYIRTWSDLILL